jgi:hypothetical protein
VAAPDTVLIPKTDARRTTHLPRHTAQRIAVVAGTTGNSGTKRKGAHHRAPTNSMETAATGVNGGRRLFHTHRPPIYHQHNGAKKPRGSSVSSGTSNSTGPSPTETKATHSASPGNRLHRTDSLACSHTGSHRASPDNRLSRADSLTYSLAGSLHFSGQQIAQGGLTRQQSRRISALLRTTSCPGRTHSPAAQPDHFVHLRRPTTRAPTRQ